MEVREGLDLAQTPFKETMIAFSDPSRRPWYVSIEQSHKPIPLNLVIFCRYTSQWAFWVLSLMLLSWPLRVLVEYKTAYVHYQVRLFVSSLEYLKLQEMAKSKRE